MNLPSLMAPARFGTLKLANRVVMAPMTRSRAQANGDSNEMITEYYRQRAGAGMIITEGIYPSEDGKGYCRTPGLVDDHQAVLWKEATDAVHAEGGTIVAQIMHVGRVAHSDNKASGAETVAPSAIPAELKIFTDTDGGRRQRCPVPRALETEEIPGVVGEFVRCTRLAYEAGFDGVEFHGTSGYLPAQFLSTGTNERNDRYGGSVANRIRFFVEAVEAMATVDGPGRVGFRIMPGNPFNDLHDDDPDETFTALLEALDPLGLAYCHVLRMDGRDNEALVRRHFSGPVILNDSYSAAEADAAIDAGRGDAVSFGRLYITNPDLAERFEAGVELASTDSANIYEPGPEGYIDFPRAPGAN